MLIKALSIRSCARASYVRSAICFFVLFWFGLVLVFLLGFFLDSPVGSEPQIRKGGKKRKRVGVWSKGEGKKREGREV